MRLIEITLLVVLFAIMAGIISKEIKGGKEREKQEERCSKCHAKAQDIPVYRIRRTKTGCLQCSKCYKFLSKSKFIDHCPHCGCEFDWVDVENFFM